MTDERTALLNAILDNPADDTVRLAYADKLDEVGGAKNAARAELIRVQCELAPLRGLTVLDAARVQYLYDREAALLKKWAGALLPKSLRPGYPALTVSGQTVAVDTLGGYVRFERGFVAHAGRAIRYSPDPEVLHDARRFGEHVRALLASNPLNGFSLSFEGSSEVLTAELGPCDNGKSWRLMWDINTYSLMPRDLIAQPVSTVNRTQMERAITPWLCGAIRGPATATATNREMEGLIPLPGDYFDPGADPPEQDGYEPGYD